MPRRVRPPTGDRRAGARAVRGHRRRQHRRQRQQQAARRSGGPRRLSRRMRSVSGLSGARGQQQAQRRGAGPEPRLDLAEQEHRPRMRLRRQLQPAQRVGRQPRRQPGQRGTDLAAGQGLLQRPQRVGRRQPRAAAAAGAAAGRGPAPAAAAIGSRPSAASVQAQGRAGGSNSITVRGRSPAPPGPRCSAASAGASSRHSPTPGCGSSSSVSTPRRPAAAGQFGVQRCKTCGQTRRRGPAETGRAPQRGMDGLR